MHRIAAPAAALVPALLWAAPAHAMDGVPWGDVVIILMVWSGLIVFAILNPVTAVGYVLAALLIEKRWWAIGAGALWGVVVAAAFGVAFEGSLDDVVASAFQYALGGVFWSAVIHMIAAWVRRRRESP